MTKIAAFPNPSGSALWRLAWPFKYLNKLGDDARVIQGGITEEVAQWADVYVLQGCVDKDGIALLHAYQKEKGKKLVVEADDAIVVEGDSPFKMEHDLANAPAVIRATMEVADLVTTTTPYLARKLREVNPNVVVLPNYLDLDVWDIPRKVNVGGRIRIGWAGSVTHLEDLKMVVEPLKALKARYPQVDLIFCGETRLRDLFTDTPIEIMLGVPPEAWPSRLSGMRLDIGIAPLRDTEFNRSKSNIKWLEYSINHIPGVFSPTVYNMPGFDGTLGQIAENIDQWYRCLENYILHPILREEIADHSYAWVRRRYDLSRHALEWARAYAGLLT